MKLWQTSFPKHKVPKPETCMEQVDNHKIYLTPLQLKLGITFSKIKAINYLQPKYFMELFRKLQALHNFSPVKLLILSLQRTNCLGKSSYLPK